MVPFASVKRSSTLSGPELIGLAKYIGPAVSQPDPIFHSIMLPEGTEYTSISTYSDMQYSLELVEKEIEGHCANEAQ